MDNEQLIDPKIDSSILSARLESICFNFKKNSIELCQYMSAMHASKS